MNVSAANQSTNQTQSKFVQSDAGLLIHYSKTNKDWISCHVRIDSDDTNELSICNNTFTRFFDQILAQCDQANSIQDLLKECTNVEFVISCQTPILPDHLCAIMRNFSLIQPFVTNIKISLSFDDFGLDIPNAMQIFVNFCNMIVNSVEKYKLSQLRLSFKGGNALIYQFFMKMLCNVLDITESNNLKLETKTKEKQGMNSKFKHLHLDLEFNEQFLNYLFKIFNVNGSLFEAFLLSLQLTECLHSFTIVFHLENDDKILSILTKLIESIAFNHSIMILKINIIKQAFFLKKHDCQGLNKKNTKQNKILDKFFTAMKNCLQYHPKRVEKNFQNRLTDDNYNNYNNNDNINDNNKNKQQRQHVQQQRIRYPFFDFYFHCRNEMFNNPVLISNALNELNNCAIIRKINWQTNKRRKPILDAALIELQAQLRETQRCNAMLVTKEHLLQLVILLSNEKIELFDCVINLGPFFNLDNKAINNQVIKQAFKALSEKGNFKKIQFQQFGLKYSQDKWLIDCMRCFIQECNVNVEYININCNDIIHANNVKTVHIFINAFFQRLDFIYDYYQQLEQCIKKTTNMIFPTDIQNVIFQFSKIYSFSLRINTITTHEWKSSDNNESTKNQLDDIQQLFGKQLAAFGHKHSQDFKPSKNSDDLKHCNCDVTNAVKYFCKKNIYLDVDYMHLPVIEPQSQLNGNPANN